MDIILPKFLTVPEDCKKIINDKAAVITASRFPDGRIEYLETISGYGIARLGYLYDETLKFKGFGAWAKVG